jgi:hypothetical protein
MLLRLSRWPIAIGARLGEDTRSTVLMTEGPKVYYVQILGRE